jgi:hypothetical protein
VIAFVFPEVRPATRRWWIVITAEGIYVCDVDPGFPVRVTVETSLRTLTLIWRGDLSWSIALRSGDLVLDGDPQAQRALPRWLKLSSMALTPRPPLRDELLTR